MSALKEALQNFRRSPGRTVLSILAITMALVLFGVFGILTAYAQGFVEKLRNNEEISIYLQDTISDAEMLALDAAVAALPGVGGTRIVSKEEAAAEFEKLFGSHLLTSLEDNPLPRSIVISMDSGHRTSADFERIGKHIENLAGVESVEYGREWMAKMDRVLSIFYGIEGILLFLVVIAGVLITSNSIGLTVVVRREAIEIMRLVGATESFIRRPFYFEGIIQGMLAGVLAFLVLFAPWIWLQYSVSSLDVQLRVLGITRETFTAGIWYLLILIPSGALLGWIGSQFALRRAV